jgi:hypothetical protein
MATIITVHGTNSGELEDEGERWWQRGSAFHKRLCTWLQLDKIPFQPFHWGVGPNSEIARRNAGRALFKQLQKHEKAGEDYCLIGHSHGGSVIHHALLVASSNGQLLPHLRSWITIGTPFLWTRPRPFLFRRLNHIGKVGFAFVITLILMMVTQVPTQYLYGKGVLRASTRSTGGPVFTDEQLDLVLYGIFFGLLFFGVFTLLLILWSQRHMRRHYALKTRLFFKINFLPRWRSLRSQEDEAINGLRATRPIKLNLFKRNLLVQPMKSLLVLVLVAFSLSGIIISAFLLYRHGFSKEFVAAYYDISYRFFSFGVLQPIDLTGLESEPLDLSHLRNWFSFGIQNPALTLAIMGGVLLYLLFLLGLYFVILWLLFALVHTVAYVLGIPTSTSLNRLTADRVRDTAFGNDTIGEEVLQVSAFPQECEADCGLLPPEVETTLSDFCGKHAGVVLARLRHILGVSTELQDRSDIVAMIAKELTSHELIHTAYFEVEEIARLIAYALHEAKLAPFAHELPNSAWGKTKDLYAQMKFAAVPGRINHTDNLSRLVQ